MTPAASKTRQEYCDFSPRFDGFVSYTLEAEADYDCFPSVLSPVGGRFDALRLAAPKSIRAINRPDSTTGRRYPIPPVEWCALMGNTRIILVRHGEVEGIEPAIFRGRLDLPLTARGIRQAELTRDYLLTLGSVAGIYASPLTRCQHTATIIGAPHDLTPGFTPELNDINYGGWQGRSHEDVQRADPDRFKTWMTSPLAFSAKTLLEVAVVLLGASLSVGTILAAGPSLPICAASPQPAGA